MFLILPFYSSQYDYCGWMPNAPSSLQLPPPTTKGTTSKATMLQTFPDVNVTVNGMSTLWLLSKQSSDFYPEDHFSERFPASVIIKVRNDSLEVPYTYMDPTKEENSVAI
uniref:Lipoxygenase domain-containing protein n=1 Tax=Labrus bergylta TaxID=56723 RepID=A0A3Q3G9C4_9LABR